MKSVLTSLFAMAVCQWAFAQAPSYLHYGVSDGLPSALVYCTAQDSMGFMWFGTDKGLVRFDGARFKVYGMRDGLPDQEVVGMFADSRGRLWVSCFGKRPAYLLDGVVYNESKDTLLKGIELAGNYIFQEDHQKRIWMSCGESRFYCFSEGKVDVFNTNYSIQGIGEFAGNVHTFAFWFIDRMLGMDSFQKQYQAPTPFLELTERAINSIREGREALTVESDRAFLSTNRFVITAQSGDRLLYAYREGLLLLDYEEDGFKEVDRRLGVQAMGIFKDRQGRFWVALRSGGVLCFDHEKDGLRRPQSYLPGKKVSNVYEDTNNNYFFTTLNEGIFVLPKNAAQTYRGGPGNPFVSDNITALCKLDDGSLLAGDDSGNLYAKDRAAWQKLQTPDNDGYNRIRQILPLPDNGWLAVASNGIYAKGMSNLSPKTSSGAYKSAFVRGTTVWVATSRYLLKWESVLDQIQVKLAGRTVVVESDSQGNLWVGRLNGLFSEKDGFERVWGDSFPPLASRIVDIEPAGPNTIWIATPDFGLLLATVRDGVVEKIELVNEKLKSPIENIQSIHHGNDGRVWLATNKGVFSIDEHWSVQHYNHTNGLASDDVNAVLVDNDTMWAATVAGLSKLQLRQQGQSNDFQTSISGLRYFDGANKHQLDLVHGMNEQGEITLPPNASMLEVEMGALSYGTRGNLQFEYSTVERLLPLQQITFRNLFSTLRKHFGGEAEVVFVDGAVRNFGANIAPGRYLTTVAAILPGGARSDHPDQITITVLPHWWQTIWFTLAIVSLLALGLMRLWRAREQFLKVQNTNSELQLQAIRAQMNPHFVGNSINAIQQFFYPPDPVKASEYISIFSDLLRRTMHFSETDFIAFDDELSYVKDYLEMIKLRFGDRFSYEIEGAAEVPGSTPFPAMLLQPVLENATLHGLAPKGSSHLNIAFAEKGGELTCTVTDNGVGIEASRARKALAPSPQRVSRGILLLEKKVQTLNQLYPAKIRLKLLDLSSTGGGKHGTQAIVTFLPQKVPLSKSNHA